MIQRIQTVYLFVAAIIPVILLFIPIGTLINDIGFYTYTPFNVKVINTDDVIITSVYNALLLILSTLVSIATIFFYKKRKLQVRMINVNMIVILGALFSMFYIYPKMVFSKYQILENATLDFNSAILITLFTAVGLYLAKKAILKDEALVKSTERLR